MIIKNRVVVKVLVHIAEGLNPILHYFGRHFTVTGVRKPNVSYLGTMSIPRKSIFGGWK